MRGGQVRRGDQRGISVVEVMIALAMASIIIASIGSLIVTIHRLDTQRTRSAAALAAARESLEVVSAEATRFFGCTCGTDSCDSVPNPRTCHRAVDGLTCTYPEGGTRCWVDHAAGTTPGGQLHAAFSGGAWSLADGAEALTGTLLTRWLQIDNAIPTGAGGPDTNFKQVRATVAWTDQSGPRTVTLTTLISSWRQP